MRDVLEQDLRTVLNGALNMLGTVETMLPLSQDALLNGNSAALAEIQQLDLKVDAAENDLEAECLRIIALHQPVARDLRMVGLILKSLSDIERMGDYAVHIAEDGVELAQMPALKQYINLERMLNRLIEMSQNLRTALSDRDVERAEQTIRMDDEIDELYEQMQRELVTYMLEDPRSISRALTLMRVGRSVERIGDHMENVSERVRYWVTGQRQ